MKKLVHTSLAKKKPPQCHCQLSPPKKTVRALHCHLRPAKRAQQHRFFIFFLLASSYFFCREAHTEARLRACASSSSYFTSPPPPSPLHFLFSTSSYFRLLSLSRPAPHRSLSRSLSLFLFTPKTQRFLTVLLVLLLLLYTSSKNLDTDTYGSHTLPSSSFVRTAAAHTVVTVNAVVVVEESLENLAAFVRSRALAAGKQRAAGVNDLSVPSSSR